ncbi:MAG: hypothetical protein WAR39_00780 [Prevotella sp.]
MKKEQYPTINHSDFTDNQDITQIRTSPIQKTRDANPYISKNDSSFIPQPLSTPRKANPCKLFIEMAHIEVQ